MKNKFPLVVWLTYSTVGTIWLLLVLVFNPKGMATQNSVFGLLIYGFPSTDLGWQVLHLSPMGNLLALGNQRLWGTNTADLLVLWLLMAVVNGGGMYLFFKSIARLVWKRKAGMKGMK